MTVFSIVTVVRNDMVGAIRTLQSVFAQEDAEYELIVQDGASTDGTAEALAGFGDWIDSYVSEPDGGIYDAMNRALARATGEWLLFLNAADFFVDERVLATVAGLIRPEDDIFVGEAIRDEDGRPHRYHPRDQYWAGSVNDHQASFIRRELMQELGYDTSYRIAGDLDFFQRAREHGARDRFEPLPIARKPFAVGASTGFLDRFRERAPMVRARYGDRFAVDETLRTALDAFVRATFGLDPAVTAGLSEAELLGRVESWTRWAA